MSVIQPLDNGRKKVKQHYPPRKELTLYIFFLFVSYESGSLTRSLLVAGEGNCRHLGEMGHQKDLYHQVALVSEMQGWVNMSIIINGIQHIDSKTEIT